MKFTLATLVLASVAYSQTIASEQAMLPSCSLTCLQNAIAGAGCSLSDYNCQCVTKKNAISAAATPCIIGACTTNDALKVQTITGQICNIALAQGSGGSSASGSSSAAAAAPASSASMSSSMASSMATSAMSSAMSATSSMASSASSAMSSMTSSMSSRASSAAAGGATSASSSGAPVATANAGSRVEGSLMGAAVMLAAFAM